MANTVAPPTSAGIETLIARLRQEGVDEGQAEADRILAEASKRARDILEKAEADAAKARDTARADAERFRKGGEEALSAAMRDAVLDLKDGLSRRFAERIHGSISQLTRDEEMLKRMILAVASRAREEAGVDDAAEVEFVLPRSAIGLEDLRKKPESLQKGTLSHFVAADAAEMLREGVIVARSEDNLDGLRVVLKKSGLVIDLTDRAVADVILRHLQPRFRALLEGVVS